MVVLEALGLALGVAPLLIEILKANPEPLDAMKALKSENAKEMMSDFVRDLQFEVSMFKLTLTALVKELHISTELKDKLIEEKTLDPMVWKVPTPELEMSLRKRLEPCFESFKQSMEQILRLLTKLVDKSDLPPPLSADKIVRTLHPSHYSSLIPFSECVWKPLTKS